MAEPGTGYRAGLLWAWLVRLLTAFWPDAAPTMRARGWLYGCAMRRRGANLQVGRGVTFHGLGLIDCGRDVYVAPGCVLLIAERLVLEDEAMLAFNVVVTDGNHSRAGVPGSWRFGRRENCPVRIGRGAWIGANAVVLPGVSVGAGAVVGAGTTVSRDVPEGARLVAAAPRYL